MTTVPQCLSLTLLNWNGFFARTFDLDPQITALAGGNGSGKSTILSAFLSALVPDLSLLQFRNSTDQHNSAHARDKGLYGKLNLGECYALIRARSIEEKEIIFGVHLQRQISREGKLQLRPLILTGALAGQDIIQLLSEPLSEDAETLRILSPMNLQKMCQTQGIQCKFYQSIGDYHYQLFLMGILPKSFRTAQERAQFYRILQASLYGGVPSSITHSLKTYLLPEQMGLKAAFKELEMALYENRLTLMALNETQSLQETFSSLLEGACRFLGSEYARTLQSLKKHRLDALNCRASVRSAHDQTNQAHQHQRHLNDQSDQLEKNITQQEALVQQLCAQHDQLKQLHALNAQLKENANEKTAHQARLTALTSEGATGEKVWLQLQSELEGIQTVVSNTHKELSDQQLALDASQIRAVQYQQALTLWKKAEALFSKEVNASLPKERTWVEKKLNDLHDARHKLDERRLELEQQGQHCALWSQRCVQLKKNLMAAILKFLPIAGDNVLDIEPDEGDGEIAIETLLLKFNRALTLAEQSVFRYDSLKQAMVAAQSACQRQKNAAKLLSNIQQLSSGIIEGAFPEDHAALLPHYHQGRETFHRNEHLLQQLLNAQSLLQYKKEENLHKKPPLEKAIARWEKARRMKEDLQQHLTQPIDSQDDLNGHYQELRVQKEKQRGEIRHQEEAIQTLQSELRHLTQPYPHHLTEKTRQQLHKISEMVQGIPLIECLSSAPFEQAKYFSALLEPYQMAFIVEDVHKAQEILKSCPAFSFELTLYLFSKSDLTLLLEQANQPSEDHGLWMDEAFLQGKRYTPFPPIPWVGEKARQKKQQELEKELTDKNKQLKQMHESALRIHQQLERVETFLLEHAPYFFHQSCPNEQLHALTHEAAALHNQLLETEQTLQTLHRQQQHLKQWLNHVETFTSEFPELFPTPAVIEKAQKEAEQTQIHFSQAKMQKDWFDAHRTLRQEIIKIEAFLNAPMGKLDAQAILHASQRVIEEQKQLLSQEFLLEDILNRWEHLFFSEESHNLEHPQKLKIQLQSKIKTLEATLSDKKRALNEKKTRLDHLKKNILELQLLVEKHEGIHQILLKNMATLHAALPQTLSHCLQTEEVQANFLKQLDEVQIQLKTLQQQRQTLTEQRAQNLAQCTQLLRQEHESRQIYATARKQLIHTKLQFLQLRQQLLDLSLNELIFQSYEKSEELLRQEADESVGQLKELTQHYPQLKEALKAAQDSGKMEQKLLFFSAVLDFLRQRIRKNFLQTHDPFQALEAMRFELIRLKNELQEREKRLKLSTQGIAQLIQRSIQREKYRIEQLNQALQGIGFGQISGIRLHLKLLHSHHEFLEKLTQADQLSLFSPSFDNDPIPQHSFLERLGALYCQIVSATPQSGIFNLAELGEKLLDYRSYLSISVELQRQSPHWNLADMGALSTGEAIGIGLTLLLLIVQSWEEESARLRGQGRRCCRILPLDEAARLDSNSIATLFELCQKLSLQLFLAAPETLQIAQGTIYQLRRLYVDNKAHVHVIGLRALGEDGLSKPISAPSPETVELLT